MTSGCGDDSESPHPCCYTPNKVETIYRTLEDIPYILQWAAGEISSKIAFFPGDAVQSGMPGSPVAVRTGALCGQLTFPLAWYREHSAVMATELL